MRHGVQLKLRYRMLTTSSRSHVLELVASLVFVALTFVTALVPDNIVGPDKSGPTTIVWIVWSWCSLFGVSVRLLRTQCL
jgi:hypothetical protein